MNMNAELEKMLVPNGRDNVYIPNWGRKAYDCLDKAPRY